jgi:hypothetical protein
LLLVSMLFAWSVALPSDDVRDLGSGKATVLVAGAHRHGGVLVNGLAKEIKGAVRLAMVLIGLIAVVSAGLRAPEVLSSPLSEGHRWPGTRRRGPPRR